MVRFVVTFGNPKRKRGTDQEKLSLAHASGFRSSPSTKYITSDSRSSKVFHGSFCGCFLVTRSVSEGLIKSNCPSLTLRVSGPGRRPHRLLLIRDHRRCSMDRFVVAFGNPKRQRGTDQEKLSLAHASGFRSWPSTKYITTESRSSSVFHGSFCSCFW